MERQDPLRAAAWLFASIFAFAATAAAASVTRTLNATLPFEKETPFAVENLAGTMRVMAADVTAVEVTATIHAENDQLAKQVTIRQISGKRGVPTLRVTYPLAAHRTIAYPGGGTSDVEYDDRHVRVSDRRGPELWADVAVRVPRQGVHGTFRNLVGALEAEGFEGAILLDAASGDITAQSLAGRVTADTGSGTVEATGVRGTFACDTGSGDCVVSDVDGDTMTCDTGSGDVRVRGVRADRLRVDTGSGDVSVDAADVAEFHADTGSGDVEFANTGLRLRRVWADTGSGNVRLRLPAEASFELRADMGSGDLACRFQDAHPIVEQRRVVGYTRGDGTVRLNVDTGSGDVIVEPLP